MSGVRTQAGAEGMTFTLATGTLTLFQMSWACVADSHDHGPQGGACIARAEGPDSIDNVIEWIFQADHGLLSTLGCSTTFVDVVPLTYVPNVRHPARLLQLLCLLRLLFFSYPSSSSSSSYSFASSFYYLCSLFVFFFFLLLLLFV